MLWRAADDKNEIGRVDNGVGKRVGENVSDSPASPVGCVAVETNYGEVMLVRKVLENLHEGLAVQPRWNRSLVEAVSVFVATYDQIHDLNNARIVVSLRDQPARCTRRKPRRPQRFSVLRKSVAGGAARGGVRGAGRAR